MKNAYEHREYFGRDGRCTLRERSIGPIVPWCIVALVAILMGKALTLPSGFWQFLKP